MWLKKSNQNAIAAGKEVTVHEKAINAYGFSGFGYIIIDPETGVGGYLIEGKGSGGSLTTKIGLALGYTLITLGILILIVAFAYFIHLLLLEYLLISAQHFMLGALFSSMGLLSLSAKNIADPCIQGIIRIIAGSIGLATIGLAASATMAWFTLVSLVSINWAIYFQDGLEPCQ